MRKPFYLLGWLLGLGFFGPSLFAQAPTQDYGLLWEVQAPNEERPSYLFGTMHVTDEKIFQLPDSVLLGIEACDGFATEVAFDEALNGFMQLLISDGLESRRGSSSKRLEEQLRKFFEGKDQRTVAQDPMRLFEDLGQDYVAGEDRETFLDAFLYRIARDGDKVVGGLENIQDQIAALLGGEDDFASGGPANSEAILKQAYITGNLEAIEAFINHPDIPQGFRDEVLIKRNYVMAQSADSLIKLRPTFVAVGAAHLPGKEGLIQLMQDRGYRVRRVNATYTGVVNEYLNRPYEPRWTRFEDEALGLKVDVPVEPFRVNLLEDQLDMQFGMDLPGGFFYAFYRLRMPGLNNSIVQSLMLEKVAGEMGMGEEAEEKDVELGEMRGREIMGPIDEYFFRIRILFDEESMVFLLAGISENTARGPVANRFMESVETFQPSPYLSRPLLEREFERFGFKAKFPVAPVLDRYVVDSEEDLFNLPGYIYTYECADDFYNQQLSVQVVDMPATAHVKADTSYLKNLMAAMTDEDIEMPTVQKVVRNGQAGLELDMEHEDNAISIRQILRGERYYHLFFTTPRKDSARYRRDEFFDSFSLMPLPPIQLNHEFEARGLQAKLPMSPEQEEGFIEYLLHDDLDTLMRYAVRDSMTSTSFSITRYELSPYLRTENLDAFLSEWVEWADSLPASAGVPEDGNIPPQLILRRSFPDWEDVQQIDEYRIYGSRIWRLSVRCPRSLAEDPAIQAFFDAADLEAGTSLARVVQPKGAQLLADLSSADGERQFQAQKKIGEYNATLEEAPLFIDALQASNTYSSEGRTSLIRQVANLGTLGSRVALEQLYFELPSDGERMVVLESLFGQGEDPEKFLGFYLMDTLRPGNFPDSYRIRELITAMLDGGHDLWQDAEMLVLFDGDRAYFAAFLAYLQEELLDGFVGQDDIQPAIDFSRDVLTREMQQPTFLSYSDSGYDLTDLLPQWLYLLEGLQLGPQDLALARQALGHSDPDVRRAAALTLIDQGENVSKKDLKSIGFEGTKGFELIRDLLYAGREDLVPGKYLKSSYIAQQAMYYELETYSWNYADYGTLAKVVPLSEEDVFWEGESQLVHTFKLAFEGDANWYLGFSGPFPKKEVPNLAGLSLSGIAEGSYHPSRYEDQLKAFLRAQRRQLYDLGE